MKEIKEIKEDDFLVELTSEEQEELKGGSISQISVDNWQHIFSRGIPNPFLRDKFINPISNQIGR